MWYTLACMRSISLPAGQRKEKAAGFVLSVLLGGKTAIYIQKELRNNPPGLHDRGRFSITVLPSSFARATHFSKNLKPFPKL